VLKYKYVSQTKYTKAILRNSTRKLLWFKITNMLIAVLKNKFMLFIVIFGTNHKLSVLIAYNSAKCSSQNSKMKIIS